MAGNPLCEHFIKRVCEYRDPDSPFVCLGNLSDGVQGCVMASQMERRAVAAKSSAQVARQPTSSPQPQATSK